MSIFCQGFRRHQWAKWTLTETSNVLRSSDNAIVGSIYRQSRQCGRCGWVQIKETMNMLF